MTAVVLAARAEVAGELVEFVFRVQLMSSPRFRGKSHAVVRNAALRDAGEKEGVFSWLLVQ
jgi:hypothetical protein